jgi:hypothetical protein
MSGSKSARNQSAIINRGNTCGGAKKSGLGYTGVGITRGNKISTYYRTVNTVWNIPCNVTIPIIQTHHYGYKARI